MIFVALYLLPPLLESAMLFNDCSAVVTKVVAGMGLVVDGQYATQAVCEALDDIVVCQVEDFEENESTDLMEALSLTRVEVIRFQKSLFALYKNSVMPKTANKSSVAPSQ